MSDTPSSGVTGLIGRILGYMDTPWKAVAVAVLFVLFGTGALIWYERDKLVEAMLSSTPSTLAKLNKAHIPVALKNLLDYTDINLAGVWEINLHANRAIFDEGRWRDGKEWVVTPKRVPFIVETTSSKVLVSLFSGHPVCMSLDDPTSDVARRIPSQMFVSAGMKRLCVVPVPPNPDILLALLIIAWKEPPSPEVEGAALGTATDTSRELITWIRGGSD